MRFLASTLVLTIFFSLAAHGVIAAPAAVSKNELVKTLELYRNAQELAVDFKMTKRLKGISTPLESEGHLKFTKPHSLVWTLVRPSPLEVVISEKEIKIISGEAPTANIQTFRRDQIQSKTSGDDAEAKKFSSLVSWLKMDAEALSRDYDVTSSGPGRYDFKPREASTIPFEQLEMEVGKTGELARLLILETTGDSMEFKFAKPHLVTTRTSRAKK